MDCLCTPEWLRLPLSEEALKRITEAVLNPHVFAPYGEARGMVSEHVKDADFECCQEHPDKASCPSGGCRHCSQPTNRKERRDE